MILSIQGRRVEEDGLISVLNDFVDTSFSVIGRAESITSCGKVCFPHYAKDLRSYARNAGYLYAFARKQQREGDWRDWLDIDLSAANAGKDIRKCALRYFDYYVRVL